MTLLRSLRLVLLCGLLGGLLSGCALKPLALRALADELAAQGAAPEEDVLLARDAAPFYLKLSESVLAQTPGHLPLAAAVTGGFTQYAYAFVAFEAEKLELQDARAARLQRERAAGLYRRAQRQGWAALTQGRPDLPAALQGPGPVTLRREELPLAYWTAAAWAAWISLAKDDPETVADLPLVLRLAEAAYAVDPTQGEGALATLLGQLEAGRPGGSAAVARAYFDAARAAGQGRNAAVPLAEAEAEALAGDDRERFATLLREALRLSAARRDLASQLLRLRAQWLLDTLDERF